jgi:hypothetical protein
MIVNQKHIFCNNIKPYDIYKLCSANCLTIVLCYAPLVISHECEKDREVLTTSETYPWSFATSIFRNGYSCGIADLGRNHMLYYMEITMRAPYDIYKLCSANCLTIVLCYALYDNVFWKAMKFNN